MLLKPRSQAPVLLLSLLLTGAITTRLHGQPANENDPPSQRRGVAATVGNQDFVTRFEGKLKTQQQRILVIVRDDGTEVLVKPPTDASKTVFTATAKPAYLRPGMLVRFTGTFNRAGVPQSSIGKVELFQPVNGKVPANQRQRFLPGVYPDKHPPQDQVAAGVAKCDVVGTLVNIDASGVMSVRAGKVPVQIPLEPDATFEICYNNLALAQVGDPVKVSGFYNPPDETRIVADSITVSTDRVYGEPTAEEPTRKQSKRRKTRGKPPTESQPNADDEANPESPSTPSAPNGGEPTTSAGGNRLRAVAGQFGGIAGGMCIL